MCQTRLFSPFLSFPSPLPFLSSSFPPFVLLISPPFSPFLLPSPPPPQMTSLEQIGEELVGQARCPFESGQSNVGLFAGEFSPKSLRSHPVNTVLTGVTGQGRRVVTFDLCVQGATSTPPP